MNRMDYKEEIENSINEWIEENEKEIPWWKIKVEDDLRDYLEEELWDEDSVTGNASGSYTFSNYEAEENVAHCWNLIEEVAECYGLIPKVSSTWEYGAEWWDVSIRCYLLSEVLSEMDFEDVIERNKENGTSN